MLEDKRLDKDVPIPLYFQLEKLILEEIDRELSGDMDDEDQEEEDPFSDDE